jgi:hypothetical protein
VLLRIQGLGFKDPTLWPFFAGERKSGSSRQGSESLLTGKKHQKLPEISPIWATFGPIFFFAVFSVFLQVYQFGVNCNYIYGSFLWNLGMRIRKIRIGFKSFFQNRLKDSEISIPKIREFVTTLTGTKEKSQRAEGIGRNRLELGEEATPPFRQNLRKDPPPIRPTLIKYKTLQMSPKIG